MEMALEFKRNNNEKHVFSLIQRKNKCGLTNGESLNITDLVLMDLG